MAKTPISEGMILAAQGKTGQDFQGWMGPASPMPAMAPPDVAGRQFDYPVGYNTNLRPRTGEAITFAQLRALADNLDILRLVIETRKDLVCAVPWEIKPKKKDVEKDSRCEEVEDFMSLPDQENTWIDWLRLVLEELFVLDAPSIYPRMTKGGKLYALEPVDGSTIVRKIDQGGRTPIPPAIAYQQVLKGVPAGDFTRDELIYKPRNIRAHKVYGFGPVEQIIMTVNLALRRQLSQLQFYTEGSTPDLILTVPEEWGLEQIKQFQAWWNEILAGNTAERKKTRFVPSGVDSINTKEGILKDEFDEWLARVITYAFSLTNLPFVRQINRATSETAQEQAVNEGLAPILGWVKNLVDYIIIKYFGYADIHMVWGDTRDPDPAQQAEIDLKKAQTEEVRIRSGVMDINEVRKELGREELSPEELAARKQSKSQPNTGTEPVQPAAQPAEKLEKKSPSTQYPFIDRDRDEVALPRQVMQNFLTAQFKIKAMMVSEQIISAYEALTKRKEDDEVAEIIDAATISFEDLAPELSDTIEDITREGVVAATLQIQIDDQDITSLAFTRAEKYAKERAGELVGMKWTGEEWITNPDPDWSITEATRNMIRTDVETAIAEGWSNDALKKAILENYAFSEARAENIARTETANADIEGNMELYKEADASGIDMQKEWWTAQDEMVCPICGPNHKAKRKLDDPFPSGHQQPTAHPSCRCDVLPVTDSK